MNESEISREMQDGALDDSRISGAISRILEHPELIGMIGSVLATPPSAKEEASEQPTQDNVSNVAAGGGDMLRGLAPMIRELQGASKSLPHGDARRESLLIALKPYLSKERCEAIDQMLRISRISEILKNMS